jgi:hypothetical protein
MQLMSAGTKPRVRPFFKAMVLLGCVVSIALGQVWTAVTPAPTSEALKGIAYVNNQFVVVGANGVILTSPSGVVWTKRTSGVSKTLNGVCASASLYVVVGDSGTILASANAITWTAKSSKTTSTLRGIAWSGTTFVAAGDASAVVSSSDGTAWTKRTLGTTTDIDGIAWGNNTFVVAGFDGMNGTVNTSANGTTWKSQTVDNYDGLLSIAWCGHSFIAGSSGLVVSSDGTAWTTYSPGLENFVFGTAGHGDRMVAVGSMGSILSSSDDSTWNSETSGVDVSLNGVTWGDNMFVAVGETGTILTSPTTSGIVKHPKSKGEMIPTISFKSHAVNFTLVASSMVTLRLLSMQGALLRSMSGSMNKGNHFLPLLKGLAQGRYLVSFKAGDYSIERSVLIVK